MTNKYLPLYAPEGGGSEPLPASAPQPAPAPAPAAGTTRQTGFSGEYVHELREENKAWRLKHSEAEQASRAKDEAVAAAKKAVDDAKLAHEEALKTAEKTAKTAADQRIIMAEMKTAALKAGMHDLDALKLADLSTIKLDDKGEVEGADALLEALKKSKPYLFGTPKGGTSNPADPPPKNPGEPKMAKDMTPAERAAFLAKHAKEHGR